MITAVILAIVILLNYAIATDRLRRLRAASEPDIGEWAGDEILQGRPVRGAVRHAQRRLLSPSEDPAAETARRYAFGLWIAFVVVAPIAFVLGRRIDPLFVNAASAPVAAICGLVGVVIASAALCQCIRFAVGPLRNPILSAAWGLGALGSLVSVVVIAAIVS